MRRLILLTVLAFGLGSCNQNMDPGNGEPFSESQKPAPKAGNERPLAAAVSGGDVKVPPFVKAYFMQRFVAALYSTPQNFNPNPKWSSPLKDPENGRVWCTDCHKGAQLNFANMPKMEKNTMDPQIVKMVEQMEKNKAFMAGLMKKWVARLNSDEFDAKGKLKEPVNCLTCHETNPAPGF
jgi:hypothetical protein